MPKESTKADCRSCMNSGFRHLVFCAFVIQFVIHFGMKAMMIAAIKMLTSAISKKKTQPSRIS